LTSWTQIQWGCDFSIQAAKPLLLAERMPLRLRLVSLNNDVDIQKL
jgi:hypothetical protein